MFKTKKSVWLKIILIFALAFFIPGISSPSQALASTSAPTVATDNASGIGDDYATLNGEIEADGGADVTEYGFYYGTSNSCSTRKKVGTSIDEGNSFKIKLSSLKSDTKYYFQSYAINSIGIKYGAVKSFTTDGSDDNTPTVTTDSASSISNDYATLNGEIESVGSDDITEYGFYYGTSNTCPTKKKVGTSIDERNSYKTKLSDLDTDTKYYFKAYAKNSDGTNYGDVEWFTTDGSDNEDVPEVTTNSASSIGDDYATLNGEIESIGDDDITEYGFYYGTSNSCTTKKKVGTSIDKRDSYKTKLSDLDEGTKYYFKAYAKNSDGIDYGDVKSFTAGGSNDEDVPEVTTDSASSIGDSYATLNGEIQSIGDDDITEYGFYYGTSNSCTTKKKVGTSIDQGDRFKIKSSDLDADTKYYFKAYAKNSDGTDYGEVKSFTTDESIDDFPEVTTKTPSVVSNNATLYGMVTSNGGSAIESYGFYYGTTSSPNTKVVVDNRNINENETFSFKLTSLQADTTYYMKAYAMNAEGTSYGTVLSFKVSGTTATATSTSKPSIFRIGAKDYTLKGLSQTADVAPYIKDSRTYLPLRFVAYTLGIADSDISWDASTKTIILKKGSQIVKLIINNKTMYANGNAIILDAAPEINNGRTCLPLASVVQAFGNTATWDAAAQSVTIQ